NLIDIVVALFVAGLGTAAVLGLIVASGSAGSRASDHVIAVNAARQEIEILRSMDAAELANRTDADLIGDVPQLANLTEGEGTITISDYAGATGVKQATVTITWHTRKRETSRSLSMSTLIVKGGVGI
ncbi:MAG: type IV pilus modification PilV family protein, partial [Armatimonadota bacterium]